MQSGRRLYAGCMDPEFGENGYAFGANTSAKLTDGSGSKR
jgi:hypothetical protein